MVEEARLEQLDTGLTPVSDGWFVVNVRDGAWVTNEGLGAAFVIEGDDAPFPDVGFTLAVLQPGQAGGRYHREANQEDFLVLAGECLLLIEGEKRPLKTWDFVHCPPNTEHGFVGTGEGPCVIFMTGARKGWPERGTVYVHSELALRHGAGVETERHRLRRPMRRSRSGNPGRRKPGMGCRGPSTCKRGDLHIKPRARCGDSPPLHIHRTEDELFQVVEGELNFRRGSERHSVAAGEFFLVPKGVAHSFVVTSTEARWFEQPAQATSCVCGGRTAVAAAVWAQAY